MMISICFSFKKKDLNGSLLNRDNVTKDIARKSLNIVAKETCAVMLRLCEEGKT